MKTSELVYDREYGLKGQPSKTVIYKGQEDKRFWFKGTQGSFWMNEDQISTLLINL